jgi:hypothetical protein
MNIRIPAVVVRISGMGRQFKFSFKGCLVHLSALGVRLCCIVAYLVEAEASVASGGLVKRALTR